MDVSYCRRKITHEATHKAINQTRKLLARGF